MNENKKHLFLPSLTLLSNDQREKMLLLRILNEIVSSFTGKFAKYCQNK